MPAKIRFFNPNSLAKPPGYSSIVEITGPGRVVYFAGQLGLDLDNKLVGAPGDFRAQCMRAFKNLQAALTAVGADFTGLVKINSYLVDIAGNIAHFRDMRDRYLNMAAPPASTTIGVPALARPGALFEIEAVAVLPPKRAASSAAKKGGAAKTARREGRRPISRRYR
jgi:enamine deaminase RidA (YjgF/YER057c/UK114 family)